MWLQQAPLMTDQLLHRVRQSGWILEKTSDSGDNVFVLKAPRKIFMIAVKYRYIKDFLLKSFIDLFYIFYIGHASMSTSQSCV